MAKTLVEISARHVHLSREDFYLLFGDEAKYEQIKMLSQSGQYATDKKVTVKTSSGEKDCRVLLPFRAKTQVELSKTDCVSLGVDAPYLTSVSDKAGRIVIAGPVAEVTRNAVIIAKRHLHISPKEAAKIGITEEDTVRITIKTDRGETIYGDIVVRINDSFNQSVHLDTDEGNAAGISGETFAELTKE